MNIFQEEVLLPSELPGSLRQLPPVGCSATDRLQSMQKRNMVEIAGDRGKKLKKRLRMKMKLTRAQKEVSLKSFMSIEGFSFFDKLPESINTCSLIMDNRLMLV